MKNSLLFVLLIVAAGAAQAQTAGVVTLRANATSATGSMAPVLTWSTSPVASTCTASGGWSGTKAASGTQTLPTITASTNYTLTCSWSTGSAQVYWTTPTTNTDGSPLTNLAAMRIYYGTSASAMTQVREINDISSVVATVSPLTSGTWFFKVKAVNANQIESSDSNVASKAITGASSASSLAITITPATTPPPPTQPPPSTTPSLKTIDTRVYEVVPVPGNWGLGRVVGSIALGRPCSTRFDVDNLYKWVDRSYVTLTATPRTNVTVARCAVR